MAEAPSATALPSDARFEWVDELASTNGELLSRLARAEHVDEGRWLIALRQTAGRGRLGRKWQDGAGNFMGSTVVALKASDPAAHTLALVAGVAAFDAVARFAPTDRLRLKWPNDLMMDDAKLAGLLLERQGDHVIVGMGINIACAPDLDERQTIALADNGIQAELGDMAQAIAERFTLELARWRSNGLAATIAQWTARGAPLGAAIAATLPDGRNVAGAYRGLAADGGLRIALADGTIQTIHAGEVAMLAARGE